VDGYVSLSFPRMIRRFGRRCELDRGWHWLQVPTTRGYVFITSVPSSKCHYQIKLTKHTHTRSVWCPVGIYRPCTVNTLYSVLNRSFTAKLQQIHLGSCCRELCPQMVLHLFVVGAPYNDGVGIDCAGTCSSLQIQ
jgi:hypothetical protein